jgi:hypothetical protein
MLTKAIVTLLFLAAALSGQSGQHPNSALASKGQLESFYLVAFEGGSLAITDVQPVAGAGSRVRFIELYPACGSYRVQENDYVFENVSVQELAAKADICASEQTIAGLLDEFKRKKKEEMWWRRQGISAQCGSGEVIQHLPTPESLRFAALEVKAPRLAASWTLFQEVGQRYTLATGKDPWLRTSSLPREQRLERLPLAEQAAIELRNGDFDLATPELPAGWRPNGDSKLSQIVPQVAEATAPEDYGVVENLDHLGVQTYEDIQYPQMAKIAHIQGDVNLVVSIDSPTGSVVNVAAQPGHPMLTQAATDAVNKWIFLHPYFGPNPLSIKVHFEVHCLPTIDTSTAAGKSLRKPTKKKQKP